MRVVNVFFFIGGPFSGCQSGRDFRTAKFWKWLLPLFQTVVSLDVFRLVTVPWMSLFNVVVMRNCSFSSAWTTAKFWPWLMWKCVSCLETLECKPLFTVFQDWQLIRNHQFLPGKSLMSLPTVIQILGLVERYACDRYVNYLYSIPDVSSSGFDQPWSWPSSTFP